jgi:hypothetical protein
MPSVRAVVAVAILGFLAVQPAQAGVRARCTHLCRPAIRACVKSHVKRRVCKRTLMSACIASRAASCLFPPSTVSGTVTSNPTTTTIPAPVCASDVDCLGDDPCGHFAHCAAGACVPASLPTCDDGSHALWVGLAKGKAGDFDIGFTLCSGGQAADYAVAGGGFICGSLTAQCPAVSGTVSGFFVARDRSGGVSVLTGPSPDGSSTEGTRAQQGAQELEQALTQTRASSGTGALAAEAQDVSAITIDLAKALAGIVPPGGAPAPCLFAGPVDPSDGTLSGGFACGGTQAGTFALQQCP